ncbi:MAG: SulP family inorganic anion transporter [Solirubrobacteraceae bacterium]
MRRLATPAGRRTLRHLVPVVSWLPAYDRRWLRPDVIAGLTLWGLLVPEAMAYAGIAGIPAQAGLYTLVASLLVYALFGTSRHLAVGPTSATAALLAATVLSVGVASGDDSYGPTASALVLVVAALFFIAGAARLGFITQFLSKPVMDGFILGLALFVAVGQLNKLFGVSKGEGNTVEKFVHVVRELPEVNTATVLVSVAALLLLFGLPRISRSLPTGLIVLFGSIAVSSALDLSGDHGVAVTGTLPQGLPTPAWPDVPAATWLTLVPSAIGIVLVAYSEALGVAHEFADRHGYEIDADQELNAHGAANLLSGLLGGLIAAGSMSASAVKEGAGARSQVANLAAWGATIVTVVLLTPLFKSLPEAVLAALIIHALWHILVARKLLAVRAVSRTEFWLAWLSFAGVVLIDVLPGMIIGLVASVLLVLYRSSRPHVATLGRDPDVPGRYVELERHPEAVPIDGLLIVRVDAPIYYANALTVRADIEEIVKAQDRPPRNLVLDAALQDSLDITSADMLVTLVGKLRRAGTDVAIADVHAPVLNFARISGLLDELGADHVFPTIDAAARALQSGSAHAPARDAVAGPATISTAPIEDSAP